MGQIRWIVSLSLIVLFSYAIVSYTIGFGADNNAVVDLGTNTEFSTLKTDIESDTITYKNTVNYSGLSIFQSEVKPTAVTTEKGTVIQDLLTIFGTFKTIINTINNELLGGKGGGFGVIFTGFITLMAVIGFLVAWKTWVGRNPD